MVRTTPLRWLAPLTALAIACTDRAAPEPVTPAPAPSAATSNQEPILASAAPAASSAPIVEPPAPAAPARLAVRIVPLGDVAQETLDAVAAGLRDHAPIDPTIAPRMALPKEDEDATKGRFRAEKLLASLANVTTAPNEKILGIAAVDIVTEKGTVKSWGVLGLGDIDGRVCVLSTFRMKRAWEHGGAPDAVVRDRLWKTAVHEIGHTLGLEHCPTHGCIMEDGGGTVKTTDHETQLCERCAALYRASIDKLTPK